MEFGFLSIVEKYLPVLEKEDKNEGEDDGHLFQRRIRGGRKIAFLFLFFLGLFHGIEKGLYPQIDTGAEHFF
jgi:hypothetical protein